MAKKSNINKEEFEKFLGWLNEDREIAGQKYDSIRFRLIKILDANGCHISEELADECIDRVIKKIDKIAETYEGDPARYCYGVAKKVFLEYTKKPKTTELPDIIARIETDLTETETDHRCLNKCLMKLELEQRKFVLRYFKGEKQDRIRRRKKIEQELGITNKALRVRIFRIKNSLHECILNCKKRESNETL